jgi:hypothetical protein
MKFTFGGAFFSNLGSTLEFKHLSFIKLVNFYIIMKFVGLQMQSIISGLG